VHSVDDVEFFSVTRCADYMRHHGWVEIVLYVVEPEPDVMSQLDARKVAEARLLADPCFRNAEMFR